MTTTPEVPRIPEELRRQADYMERWARERPNLFDEFRDAFDVAAARLRDAADAIASLVRERDEARQERDALTAQAKGSAAERSALVAELAKRTAALQAGEARIKELESDAKRLDWLEENQTLHRGVEFLYEVDRYSVRTTYDGEDTAETHGETIRAAIDVFRLAVHPTEAEARAAGEPKESPNG